MGMEAGINLWVPTLCQTFLLDLSTSCIFLETRAIDESQEICHFCRCCLSRNCTGWKETVRTVQRERNLESAKEEVLKRITVVAYLLQQEHMWSTFAFLVWYLGDQCNSCGLKSSIRKGYKLLHHKWVRESVSLWGPRRPEKREDTTLGKWISCQKMDLHFPYYSSFAFLAYVWWSMLFFPSVEPGIKV